jgi:hypothetical protein
MTRKGILFRKNCLKKNTSIDIMYSTLIKQTKKVFFWIDKGNQLVCFLTPYRIGFPPEFNEKIEESTESFESTCALLCKVVDGFNFYIAPGEADVAISATINGKNEPVFAVSTDSDLWMLYPNNQRVIRPDFKNKVFLIWLNKSVCCTTKRKKHSSRWV